MKSLMSCKKNFFSQNGEDGIIDNIFKTLGISKGFFCEFGAWDGKHLSNTYNLYQQGWSGWYIEGSKTKYNDLVNNINSSRVQKICAWVSIDGPSSLDNLLKNTSLFKENEGRVDLLSIDIDSDDLAVWKSIKDFRSTVVVIEYNWSIPFDTYFENPYGENKGNSALSICEFAKASNYDLIGVTSCNLIFIDKSKNKDLFEVINLTDREIDGGGRYFFGYDGTLIMAKSGVNGTYEVSEVMRVPWNSGFFTQPVTKWSRKFDNRLYKYINLILSLISTIVRRPYSIAIKAARSFFGMLKN